MADGVRKDEEFSGTRPVEERHRIDELRLDGWLLRFGEGYSSRLNSVSALNYTGSDLAGSIEAAEAAYRAQHLPPVFHVSPANDPLPQAAVAA